MKKMLLILPKYFSYEKHIKKQLEELNYDVYMIYENIDEYSIRCKYAIKIKKEKIFSLLYAYIINMRALE